MSDARQAGLGVLAALLSAVVIFGSMLLALTEGGQLVALLPTLSATAPVLTPPFTLAPGEPTFTPSAAFFPSLTPTLAMAENCPPPDGWIVIEIPSNATLDEIAAAYGSTPELIMEKNCLSGPTIWSGFFLLVPPPPFTPTSTITATSLPATATRAPATARPAVVCPPPPRGWVPYFVRRGDTLSAIGRAYGVSAAQLMAANCLRSDLIRVGQRLYVPNVPTRTPTLPIPSNTPRPSFTPTLPLITTVPPSTTPAITPPFTPTFTPTFTNVPTTVVPPSPTQTPTPPTVEPPTPTPTRTLPPPPPATPTSTPFPTPVTPPTATATSGPVP